MTYRADWPLATIRHNELPAGAEVRDGEWAVPYGDEEMEGHSHVDGTCIYLGGPISLVADFALWYRALVREDIDVVFCDESYSFDVPLDGSQTRDELIEAAAA